MKHPTTREPIISAALTLPCPNPACDGTMVLDVEGCGVRADIFNYTGVRYLCLTCQAETSWPLSLNPDVWVKWLSVQRTTEPATDTPSPVPTLDDRRPATGEEQPTAQQ